MPTITGVHTEQYFANSIGKTYTFAKSYRGQVTDDEAIEELGSNNTIVMHGTVKSGSGYTAIYSSGDEVTIRIASSGVVSGDDDGIHCNGDGASVINAGKISGSGLYGVWLSGSDSEFINSGKVTGSYGAVHVNQNGSRVVNEKGGLMSADDGAVYLHGSEGDNLKFVNHGKVESNYAAIRGTGSNDTVINDGKIVGYIWLEDGNDKVDTRGGKITTGSVYGGAGNDTLITHKAGYKLLEDPGSGQGYDAVRSTVTYTLSDNVEQLVLLGKKNIDGTGTNDDNKLIGNAGNNVLRGLEGDDTLDGKAGKDVLWGGLGADTFVFKTGYGKDRIADYVDGTDKIDVSGWTAITDFDDMIDNHASDHGADVWIKAGSDVLVIKNMQEADLDASGFVF